MPKGVLYRSILVGAILGLLTVGLSSWAIQAWQRGRQLEAITLQLPRDTLFFVSVRGWDDLAREYRHEFRRISENNGPNDPVSVIRQALQPDPSTPLSIEDSGLSFSQPWTAALVPGQNDGAIDFIVSIPIRSSQIAAHYLDQLVLSNGLTVRNVSENESGFVLVDERIAYRIRESRLVACLPISRSGIRYPESFHASEATSCLDGLETIDPRHSLGSNQEFRDASIHIDEDWNLLAYVSPEQWNTLSSFLPMIPDEASGLSSDLAARTSAIIGTTTIHRNQIRTKVILSTQSEIPERFGLMGEDRLSHRIPGAPIAFARLSGHFEDLWTSLQNWDEFEETEFALDPALSAGLEFGLQDGLLANLGGHLGMVLLDAEPEIPYRGAVLYGQVEDPEAARSTLDATLEGIRSNGIEFHHEGEERWPYVRMETEVDTCLGLARNHIVVVLGNDRCEPVFSGIAMDHGSYLDELSPDAEDSMEDGPETYAYLDAHATTRLMARLLDLDEESVRPWVRTIQLVESIELLGRTRSDHAVMEFLVHPIREDLGFGLEALAAHLSSEQIP